MNTKQWIDQALLHTAQAQVSNGRLQPNNAKQSLKKAIDDLKAAYTILDGNDPNYRRDDGNSL